MLKIIKFIIQFQIMAMRYNIHCDAANTVDNKQSTWLFLNRAP